jgi:amino acid permease
VSTAGSTPPRPDRIDNKTRCSLINLLAVQWYGESEFWAALGKVLLIIGLLIFTFIVMLGGNPMHDRFGFRCAVSLLPFHTPHLTAPPP